MNKLRIAIADDHDIVLAGVRTQLGQEKNICVVGEAKDGRQALEIVRKEHPDILIIDKQMPGLDGILAAQQALKIAGTKLRVIMLTMFSDKIHLRRAFQAGVSAYVLKGRAGQELIDAIQSVLAGERYISPSLAKEANEIFSEFDQESPKALHETLAPRARETMDYLLRGHTNKEIAQLMNIGEKTADTYRQTIYRTLGVHTRLQLFRYGVMNKLVDVDEDGVPLQ